MRVLKRTLSLLLILVLALQSLIAAADMHHGAESLAASAPVVHHDHDEQHHHPSSNASDFSHSHSCHTHICFSLHLACGSPRVAADTAAQVWCPAGQDRFDSWVPRPAFRPPIA